MKIKQQIKLDRLIGKVDNDFNISESDWIPRVAAWTIDALSQMKLLPMECKKEHQMLKKEQLYFLVLLMLKKLKYMIPMVVK